MRTARRVLEQDMALPEGKLDEQKQLVKELVDAALMGRLGNDETSKEPSEAKRKRQNGASKKQKESKSKRKPKQNRKAQATGTTGLGASAKGKKLKRAAKEAGMTIPPTYYKRATTEDEFIQLVEEMLAKEGISGDSDKADLRAVRERKERERDLEGIDTANIIAEARTSRTRRPPEGSL